MLYNLFENRDFVSVFAVALLAEGVDRNFMKKTLTSLEEAVALLAEGVDRNLDKAIAAISPEVALLAEGVDRNSTPSRHILSSSRRPPRGGRG